MTNYNTTYLRDSTKKSFAERDTHVFSDKRLNAFVYENAYVLPYKETKDPCHIYAGVVSEKNEYLEQSAFHENIGMGYSFSKKGVVTIDVPVIYLGVIENCWGHVITDALKKIWYIRTVEGNKLLQNGGVIYVTRFNRPLALHTIEILELAGLDITKCVHIKEITKCNRLILPDNSLYLSNGYRFYTQEFKEIIQLIQMNVQKKMAHTCLPIYDKLYFTRTKLNDWRDHGEASIEKVFKKKGFQIIAPEQYSPTEQIYMLMHCAEFATMSGSPAHSAEFCMKGTTFIDIRKADYWNTYQEVVNDLADLNVVLVDAHKSCMVKSNAPWGGPFFVYLTPEIKRYSGVVRFALPLILRPSWLKYRYRNYLKECYYNIRAKLGIKTKLKKIYSRIRLVRFYS